MIMVFLHDWFFFLIWLQIIGNSFQCFFRKILLSNKKGSLRKLLCLISNKITDRGLIFVFKCNVLWQFKRHSQHLKLLKVYFYEIKAIFSQKMFQFMSGSICYYERFWLQLLTFLWFCWPVRFVLKCLECLYF